MNQADEASVSVPGDHPARRRLVRRIFLGFTLLLATAIAACQVHYYQARKTPAVRGIVRDMQTGKPIKDAYVCVTVFGFPADPVAAIASPPKWALAGTTVTTGADGRFCAGDPEAVSE